MITYRCVVRINVCTHNTMQNMCCRLHLKRQKKRSILLSVSVAEQKLKTLIVFQPQSMVLRLGAWVLWRQPFVLLLYALQLRITYVLCRKRHVYKNMFYSLLRINMVSVSEVRRFLMLIWVFIISTCEYKGCYDFQSLPRHINTSVSACYSTR